MGKHPPATYPKKVEKKIGIGVDFHHYKRNTIYMNNGANKMNITRGANLVANDNSPSKTLSRAVARLQAQLDADWLAVSYFEGNENAPARYTISVSEYSHHEDDDGERSVGFCYFTIEGGPLQA
jgi:hypothetical protein